MGGKVAPGDPEDAGTIEAAPTGRFGTLAAQARARPWLTALVVLLVCGLVVVAVTVPVCVVLGCPAKGSSTQDSLTPGLPRLLVQYNDSSIDALALLPAVLQQYVTNTILEGSLIQILDFGNVTEDAEALLQAAKPYLESQPGLNFLLRDFSMSIGSNPASDLANAAGSLQTILDSLVSTSSLPFRRRGRDLKTSGAAAGVINDPFYDNGTQYYVDQVNASGAWAYQNSSSNIVVAVIDTGCDLTHPDIAANLWVNPLEALHPNDGIDNDGNGYIDDVNGFDFVGGCTVAAPGSCTSSLQCTNRSQPWATSGQSEYYHGTHVAGVLGAVQNNGKGTTGITNGAKLMILRVANCVDGTIDDQGNGNFQASAMYKAFQYALKNGANIISFSIGPTMGLGGAGLTVQTYSAIPGIRPQYPWNNTYAAQNASYIQALTPLTNKGVLVVASAGNDNLDVNALNNLGWFVGACGTMLPNILCVGAVDWINQKANFSSFGSPVVHMGAPGWSIMSTFFTNTSGTLAHSWAAVSGTSESAPMVAGAAATVLARLGAADGNYFKASQVKSILMNTANYGSNLPWATGSVLNSGLATWWAGVQLQQSNVLISVAPFSKSTTFPSSALSFRGLAANYYATPGNAFFSDLSQAGAPVDSTLLRLSSPTLATNFSGFKYSTGYILSYTGVMQINTTGQWAVQVQCVGPMDARSVWVLLNGQYVNINTTTATGIFTVNATGWFNFELRLAFPQGSYALLFSSPQSKGVFSSYYGFWATQPQAPALPDYAPNTQMSWYWQVYYNRSAAGSSFTASTLASQTPSAYYTYSTVLPDLSSLNTGLPGLLFPGDLTAGNASVAGYYQTYLRSMSSFSVAWNLTCYGCQLWLDGVLLVDIYEPLLSNVALTKLSPCVALTGGVTHTLVLRFAWTSLGRSLPLLTYTSTCNRDTWAYGPPSSATTLLNATWQVRGGLAPLVTGGTPVVYNPLVWQPSDGADSLGTAGYIGGLQCDVYRNATIGAPTLSFSAQSTLPLYKIRLPLCAVNLTWCTSPWSFTLESLFPGLTAGSAAGTTYGVRCWTYYVSGFQSLAVTPAANSTVYLGGQKVWGNNSTAAPAVTVRAGSVLSQSGGPVYQLLAVDWTNVAPSATLSVSDSGKPLTISVDTMMLPLGSVAFAASYTDLFTGATVVGVSAAGGGATARTAWAPSGAGADISGLVSFNLTQAYAAMLPIDACIEDTSSGLYGSYAFPQLGRAPSPARVRYTQVQGYVYPYTVGNMTFSVSDSSASSVTAVIGNITVLNARQYASSNSPATSRFQIYFPTQNRMGSVLLYMSVTSKALRSDTSSSLAVSITAPTSTAEYSDINGPLYGGASLYFYQTSGSC